MPNFARQLRGASERGRCPYSSSSFPSRNEEEGDDDLHLSSHEISDHHRDDYPAAEDGHPSLSSSDGNVDDAYDFQFAIAPPQDHQHQQQRQPSQKKFRGRQRHKQELTRIPLTDMNSTDHILDHTFGDSLQSLSESLSNLDADVANEEELALKIIEEAHAAKNYDAADVGHDYDGRRYRRRRVMLGCCSIIVGIVVISAFAGKSHTLNDNNEDDPLGWLSQDPDDISSETDAWERICSVHSVSSAKGRHHCADACRIYDCCAADDGDNEKNQLFRPKEGRLSAVLEALSGRSRIGSRSINTTHSGKNIRLGAATADPGVREGQHQHRQVRSMFRHVC